MTIEFIRPEVDELKPRISVIGVGGAGGNAIANMIDSDVQGVDFIVANTDAQALNASSADRRMRSVWASAPSGSTTCGSNVPSREHPRSSCRARPPTWPQPPV